MPFQILIDAALHQQSALPYIAIICALDDVTHVCYTNVRYQLKNTRQKNFGNLKPDDHNGLMKDICEKMVYTYIDLPC